jgi:hypothetical protein
MLLVVGATATVIGRRLAGSRRPRIREADEVGVASLVDAAEAAGVQRFVYVSFAGVDAALGTPLERAKVAIEHRLSRSTIRGVVVRPDAFQEIHLGRWSKNQAIALVESLAGRRMKVQRMPRPVAGLAIRVLNRTNDALASAFGGGLLQDLQPAT